MENDCNLTIIKNKEDLENYRKTLESAKSSLSILMIPYLMCKVNYTGLSNILKGEINSYAGKKIAKWVRKTNEALNK